MICFISAVYFFAHFLLLLRFPTKKGTEKMKIKYEFADETIEIEVSEDWGAVLITSKISDSVEHKEACEQAEDRVELYSDTEDHTLGPVVFFLGKDVD